MNEGLTVSFLTEGNDDINNKVLVNRYKNVIIVASNIAEASITIPTLKFVIDLG